MNLYITPEEDNVGDTPIDNSIHDIETTTNNIQELLEQEENQYIPEEIRVILLEIEPEKAHNFIWWFPIGRNVLELIINEADIFSTKELKYILNLGNCEEAIILTKSIPTIHSRLKQIGLLTKSEKEFLMKGYLDNPKQTIEKITKFQKQSFAKRIINIIKTPSN